MASIFHTFPLLRQAAPRLSRQFFTCNASKAHLLPFPPKAHVNTSPFSNAFRNAQIRFASSGASADAASSASSPLANLSRSIAPKTAKGSFFPETSSRTVGYWLLGSAFSVFGIVVFGGLTRLTESGLSITEWRPVTGSLPPTTADDWDSEFTKYRSSPEFRILNPMMTLDEFKNIYWMEWTHRLWGRFVGLSFVLPAAYFVLRRRVARPLAVRLGGIALLIGAQGAIGWWMVKSGLRDDLFAEPGAHPRVSQYRLAAHLGAAFACYAAMLWNGLQVLREHRLLKRTEPQAALDALATLRRPELRVFRRSVLALGVLVSVTALSGALVAGLDAGLIYNEFPYMGEGIVPPRTELFKDFYARRADKSDRWWRNPLENPTLVQFDHRVLATTTFTSVVALFAYAKYSPTMKRLLPAACKRGMHGVLGFACLQVALGITTLLYLVPIPLASAHQAGSLALLSWVLVLGSRTAVPGRLLRLVERRAAMAKRVR